jgi:hypothetical protein
MLQDNKYIISFDPGRTTGLVVAYYAQQKFLITLADEISWNDRFSMTRDVIFEYRKHLCTLLIEDFRLRKDLAEAQAGDDMPSSQMIGIIECRAFDLGISHLIRKQMPSCKTRVQILDRHYPVLGKSNHIQDAYRHVRYLITSELAKTGGKS